MDFFITSVNDNFGIRGLIDGIYLECRNSKLHRAEHNFILFIVIRPSAGGICETIYA